MRSFEIRNKNDATDYFLFFATKNVTGLRKMKDAMWSVDQSGEFTFSDGTNPDQMLLFVVEETAFRETHYKGVLKELELGSPAGVIIVNAPSKRKKGTFADPTLRLRFASTDGDPR